MDTVSLTPQNQQIMPQEHRENRSFWVRTPMNLDFVYYAVATEHLGQVNTFFEHEMEEGSNGNFLVTVPCPPGRLDHWTILVYGYRDGERVLEKQLNAREIF